MGNVESFRRVPRRPDTGAGSLRAAVAACVLRTPDLPSDDATPPDGEALLALLASGEPPAFATDSRDRIVFWNRGMADLLGEASHWALGRRCYETISGRDVFGNRFCYANCPVLATLREGDPVCGFEVNVKTAAPDRRAVGLTILKIPGARPDLFTLVHIVQPVARAGRFGEILAGLAEKGLEVKHSRAALKARAPAPPALTPRETEVLQRVASGLQNKEVADTLGLSVATVRNHLHNIFAKLGVHSRLEAVSLAFHNGWIVLDGGPAVRALELAGQE